jgi:indole-3-acetate monooxygenase
MNADADPDRLAAARLAATAIAPLAAQIEAGRRLPPEAVRALATAGAFKLLVPRGLGGAEASMATLIGVLEEIARGDGSAGWCAMIGATSGLMAAYLDAEVAREVFGADDAVASGVFAGLGKATREPGGGYRVRGRWPFASGCEHSPWRMGGVTIDGPVPHHALFRADETRVIDTWDVSGLRGTGSHDLEVDDVVIPARRVFSLFDPPRVDGALYRLPFFGVLATAVASVGLGIARAAIDAFIAYATRPDPGGAPRPVLHREVAQLQLAQAEARLGAGRAGLLMASAAVEREVAAGGAAALPTRARLRIAAWHAATEAAGAVDLCYQLGGAASIRAASPLQRQFRDVHVVTQHAVVSAATASYASRALLGLDVNPNGL